MSIQTKPPDYSSMSPVQLKFMLAKQIALKQSISKHLPDDGRRLDQSILRIQSILESIANPSSISTPNLKSSPERPRNSSYISKIDENYDELSECLGSLNLGTSKECADDEDLFQFSTEPLEAKEITGLIKSCNIPSTYERCAVYHSFMFRLNVLSEPADGLACLVVIDCWDTERRLIRLGSLATWAIQLKPFVKKRTSEDPDCPRTCAAAYEAVADIWRFVGSGTSTRPILIAASQEALLSLRRLFCSLSVRHSQDAQEGLPEGILFAVDTKMDAVERSIQSPLQNTSISVSLELTSCLERCSHWTSIDSASVAKLRPKTAAWLEAPLNLFRLRAISFVPEVTSTQAPFVSSSSASAGPTTDPSPAMPILSHVDEGLLQRLASVGFSPSRLSHLAGHGQWRGFTGVLVALNITNDVHVIRHLYCHFRRVHRALVLNAGLYNEGPSTLATGGPWGRTSRRLKTLTMEQSIDFMIHAREEYKSVQKKADFKSPSTSDNFMRCADTPLRR